MAGSATIEEMEGRDSQFSVAIPYDDRGRDRSIAGERFGSGRVPFVRVDGKPIRQGYIRRCGGMGVYASDAANVVQDSNGHWAGTTVRIDDGIYFVRVARAART